MFPRETSCQIQSALANALGYLGAYREGDIPPDRINEVFAKAE